MSSDTSGDGVSVSEGVEPAPLSDGDSSLPSDENADPAQQEWDRTTALDEHGAADEEQTATGRDPAEIPDDDDDIPVEDLPSSTLQPDTQGSDPVDAELGDEGQGDLAPEDL